MAKHFFIPLALLLGVAGRFPCLHAQEYWRLLEKTTTQNLHRCFFLDSTHGWVVGDSGTLLMTTDGGTSWGTQSIKGVAGRLVDVFLLDENNGWILSHELPGDSIKEYGTYVIRTRNGGRDWERSWYGSVLYNAITFIDTSRGWMGGELGVLVGTSDGGHSWFSATIDSSVYMTFPIRRIKFLNPSLGVAVGGFRELSGVIWRTTNGGDRWKQLGLGDELTDFRYIDSLSFFAVGGGLDDGAGIATTGDGGNSWHFHYVGIFGQAKGVAFRTLNERWVTLGGTGSAMFTTDGGEAWTEVYMPESTAVEDVAFPDSTTGYMVGVSGSILKYNFATVDLAVQSGWNLLSLPLAVQETRKELLYPGSSSEAFIYQGGYIPVDTLPYGRAFWLKFNNDQTLHFTGIPRSFDTLRISSGWNMIGTVTPPLPVNKILQQPDSLLSSNFFQYLGAYQPKDTLQPGRGYWVKARTDGRIILPRY